MVSLEWCCLLVCNWLWDRSWQGLHTHLGSYVWLALAGMMGQLSSVLMSQPPAGSSSMFSGPRQRSKSRASGNVPGFLRPRLGTGTLLLLLYSLGQSKLQVQAKMKRRGSRVLTSLLKLQNYIADGTSSERNEEHMGPLIQSTTHFMTYTLHRA